MANFWDDLDGGISTPGQGMSEFWGPEVGPAAPPMATAPPPPFGTFPGAGGGGGAQPPVTPGDPSSIAAWWQWAGSQPGADPSINSDPGYWIGKSLSGEFGSDTGYWLSKATRPTSGPSGFGGGEYGSNTYTPLSSFQVDPKGYGQFSAPSVNAPQPFGYNGPAAPTAPKPFQFPGTYSPSSGAQGGPGSSLGLSGTGGGAGPQVGQTAGGGYNIDGQPQYAEGGPEATQGGWSGVPSFTYTGPGVDVPPEYQGGQGLPPGFTPNTFTAPTGEEALKDDPGYQFRLKQQQDALLQNKAAFGTLMNTGTAQSLMDLSGQLASQEYGNVYNRRFGEFGQSEQERLAAAQQAQSLQAQGYGQGLSSAQFNAQAKAEAQGRAYGQQSNTFGLNEAAQNQRFGQALSQAQFNAQTPLAYQQQAWQQQYTPWAQQASNELAAGQTNASLAGQTNALNAQQQQALAEAKFRAYQSDIQQAQYGAGMGLNWAQFGLGAQNQGYNQGLQTYLTNYQTQVTDPWNQQFGLAQLGQQAASSSGQFGNNFGNGAAGLITDAGNAGAAGTVGAANSWGGFFGNLGNTAASAYGAYGYLKPPSAKPIQNFTLPANNGVIY